MTPRRMVCAIAVSVLLRSIVSRVAPLGAAALVTECTVAAVQGKAPAGTTVGKIDRTRPLCPHPQVARYTGRGSIDEGANFRCEGPGR
jgi:hypothetical protein